MNDLDLNNLFKHNYVFGRGVLHPLFQNPFSIYNESFLETELRKLSREPNTSRSEKMKMIKRGNPNRSTVMLGLQCNLFTNVGFGIINPDINDILRVSNCYIGTGEGSKSNVYDFMQSKETVLKNLPILKSKLDSGNKEDETSEIILNIHNDDKLKFIYFNVNHNVDVLSGESSNIILNTLKAIYLHDKFVEKLDRELPIIGLSKNLIKPLLFKYDDKTIESLLIAAKNIDNNFFNYEENINYIIHFSKYLKNTELHNEIKEILESLFKKKTTEKLLGFNDVYLNLNIALALKKFGMDAKSDLLIEKTLDLISPEVSYHQSHLISSFAKLDITRNEDFRYVRNLHKTQVIFDVKKSDIENVSGYLSRFSNELNKDSLIIASKSGLPIIRKKLQMNHSLTSKSLASLAKKALHQAKLL